MKSARRIVIAAWLAVPMPAVADAAGAGPSPWNGAGRGAETADVEDEFSGSPEERLEKLRNWLRQRELERRGGESAPMDPVEGLEEGSLEVVPGSSKDRVRHVYYPGRSHPLRVHAGKRAHSMTRGTGKRRGATAARVRSRASVSTAAPRHRVRALQPRRRYR